MTTPADTARAAPGSNQIPNAITDDEIGAALAAIPEIPMPQAPEQMQEAQ